MTNKNKDFRREANTKTADFLAKVFHDIKNPLTVVKLYLDLVKANLDNNKKIKKEWINTIDSEIDRTVKLINKFSKEKNIF